MISTIFGCTKYVGRIERIYKGIISHNDAQIIIKFSDDDATASICTSKYRFTQATYDKLLLLEKGDEVNIQVNHPTKELEVSIE